MEKDDWCSGGGYCTGEKTSSPFKLWAGLELGLKMPFCLLYNAERIKRSIKCPQIFYVIFVSILLTFPGEPRSPRVVDFGGENVSIESIL